MPLDALLQAERAAHLATSPDTAMARRTGEAPADLLSRYQPPYDLTADLLLVLAPCPTAPLRRAFPKLKLLSLLGRTPLLLWFSRTTRVSYQNADGARRGDGDARSALYHELNVVAPLQDRALFVPAIYATGERTIQIGRGYYGMPKQPATIYLRVSGERFVASAADGPCRGYVRARLFGSGEHLARLTARWWPRRLGPVHFPGTRRELRALIQEVPAVRPAYVYAGRLALRAAWLPRSVPLLPVGLYLPGLRMQLPP
jgi:hypothetical protein